MTRTYPVLVNLNDQDIEEFVDVWQQEFGETLSAEEARHEASLLLELCSLLARASSGLASSNAEE